MFGIKKYEPPTIVIPDHLPNVQQVEHVLKVTTHDALKLGYANEVARMSVINQRKLAMLEQAERNKTKKKIFGSDRNRGTASSGNGSSGGNGQGWEVCPPDMYEPG